MEQLETLHVFDNRSQTGIDAPASMPVWFRLSGGQKGGPPHCAQAQCLTKSGCCPQVSRRRGRCSRSKHGATATPGGVVQLNPDSPSGLPMTLLCSSKPGPNDLQAEPQHPHCSQAPARCQQWLGPQVSQRHERCSSWVNKAAASLAAPIPQARPA